MEKDFWKWHDLKTKIERKDRSPLFHEAEIWWSSLGANVGVEEDGKNDLFERPILIFHKFNKDMFCGLPMSSVKKSGKYDYSIFVHGYERTILLSQIRTLSAKRLIRRAGKLQRKKFLRIARILAVFLENKTDPLRGPRVPRAHSETSHEKF
jgi:mRNA-degrading endonuclease toxin of MazEF toxin-antitoxin module